MWTLLVLVLNVLPPQGITVRGFPDEAACLWEAKKFCEGDGRYRCKCVDSEHQSSNR
jgi:hypothetical protein